MKRWKTLLMAFSPVWLMLVLAATPSTAQDASYAQAESLVRAGQLDQGIDMVREVLQSEPRNVKALNLLGIALTSKGDIAGANREYRKAVEIDPGFYHALKNLAINELAQKDIAGAKRDLTVALKYAPADTGMHSYLGRIAYAEKDYAAAEAHLSKIDVMKNPELASELIDSDLCTHKQERALDLLKKFSPADFTDREQFRLGLGLASSRLFQDAIPYFQAVSAKYPESYDAAFNLGLCMVESKQFGPAITVLRGAVDHGHNTPELDNLLAEAYEGNNQTQEAIDTLREATRLDPQDEDNFVDLAALCTKYEAFQIGLDVIEVGLHYHPQSDRLIFDRGVIYAMTNKFDLADKDFQAAARLAPAKNISYVALGITYMQAGDLRKSIAELRTRIRQKPNDPTLQYLLGEALIRDGAAPGQPEFAEAKSALQKSVRLNEKFAPAHVDLAKLYLKENRLDAAIQQLETARLLDPKDKSAYSQLAVAYRRSGEAEKAAAMLAELNRINEEERNEAGHQKRLRSLQEDTAQSGG